MQRILTFCWREWRAQRALLLGYLGLGLAALCLLFTLMPESWWREPGRGAMALAWFFAIGVTGVVAFAAPSLVTSEYGGKDDQFVRRLPGALLPSFGGKLLFLTIVAAVLPLAAALTGIGFLRVMGAPWEFDVAGPQNGERIDWPWPACVCGIAAVFAPWVWAIATWLPRGRMALGATLLAMLLLGLAVQVVLGTSPGIQKGIAWERWIAFVPAAGLVVAGVSWVRGRRVGGPLRSALWGLGASAVALVPPALWFTERAYDYHHPDPQQVRELHVYGVTPDHQHALVAGRSHADYASVPFRVDLRTGDARQLAGIYSNFDADVVAPAWPWGPAMTRFFSCYERHPWSGSGQHRIYDLEQDVFAAAARDEVTGALQVPRDIEAVVRATRMAHPVLQAPGGVPVWFDADGLCFRDDAGDIEHVRWEAPLPRTFMAAGHGVRSFVPPRLFDLTARRFVANADSIDSACFVRGTLLSQAKRKPSGWQRLDADSAAAVPVPELLGAEVLGLFDDEQVLCAQGAAQDRDARLFLWRAADGAVTPIALPEGARRFRSFRKDGPDALGSSLLPRDPGGRIWLRADGTQYPSRAFVVVDGASHFVCVVVPVDQDGAQLALLGWPSANSALLQDGATIQRLDVTTGARTQLFPRR